MGETLKSTVKNKFKKVAENELNILIEVIYQVEMDKLSKLQGLFGQSWNLKFVIKEYDGKIFEVTCEKILTEKSFWISILKKMW